MNWIDVHTHLNMIEKDTEAVLASAASCGISKMITIGTGTDDNYKILEFVKRFPNVVYGTLGYHPHDAKDYNSTNEEFIRGHLNHPGIVGIGEIGLDYFYNHSEREVQREAFRRQMTLAEEFNLPVEIHTRDAEPDTIEILKEFEGKVHGLLHCFTGTRWLADQALAIGYNISISGVVTFKNADPLRAIVKTVPLDRLHVETDAPFLTPVPFRGKKNEPALLIHTAEIIAGVKEVTLEELASATTENAKKLFKRI